MGLIVVECMASNEPTRQLFFIPYPIPTKYFPLALYALFALFGGLNLGMAISMGVGYLYSLGHLDVLKPTDLPTDTGDELVKEAIENDAFATQESLRDPTTYTEYKAVHDRDKFQTAVYDEVYQLLDKYKTLKSVTIDDRSPLVLVVALYSDSTSCCAGYLFNEALCRLV